MAKKKTKDITEEEKKKCEASFKGETGIFVIEKVTSDIKLFPNENIVLSKKFNNRKPDIWSKNHDLIIEVDEGNHENYDSDDEKEREGMFKKHNSKMFPCNPNDQVLIFLNF